jgi:hypothetical protein
MPKARVFVFYGFLAGLDSLKFGANEFSSVVAGHTIVRHNFFQYAPHHE